MICSLHVTSILSQLLYCHFSVLNSACLAGLPGKEEVVNIVFAELDAFDDVPVVTGAMVIGVVAVTAVVL